MQGINLNQPPSKALYLHVRAALAILDISLNKAAADIGTSQNGIRQALVGAWNGEKGSMVKHNIINYLKEKLEGEPDDSKIA